MHDCHGLSLHARRTYYLGCKNYKLLFNLFSYFNVEMCITRGPTWRLHYVTEIVIWRGREATWQDTVKHRAGWQRRGKMEFTADRCEGAGESTEGGGGGGGGGDVQERGEERVRSRLSLFVARVCGLVET